MTDTWDRKPDEPNLWYDRFDVYRLLGPRRSVERAFNVLRQSGQLRGARPGAAWYNAAKQWHWKQRAEAWDTQERERLRQIESTRREDAHNERIDMIQVILDTSFERLLPTLQLPDNTDLAAFRLIFKDALEQQRRELPIDDTDDHHEEVTITADDLLAAQRQLSSWHDAVRSANGGAAPFLSLRACLSKLYPDPSSARRVAEQAGLDLSRIQFAARAVDTWHAILSEAERNQQIPDLTAVARSEYPNNPELNKCLNQLPHHA